MAYIIYEINQILYIILLCTTDKITYILNIKVNIILIILYVIYTIIV